jgi:hypothetical protein
MSKDNYEKITLTQHKPNANIASDKWGSIAEMYRDLKPQVTYHAFLGRINKGMDPMTAATKPRDARGRKGRIQFS